jgi:hypothetical protein
MSGARVFPFFFRGDDSRRMRVVIAADNHVSIEEFKGCDALGVERWMDVDVYADDDYNDPAVPAFDWVEMVALAVAQPCQPQPPARTEQHYHFSTGGGCPITVNATADRVSVNGNDVEVTP